MKKITYKLSNIFTLKQYEDNNLNCRTFEYPTIYGIKCAIIGAIIQTDGVEKAEELFNKVKNSIIYVQFPKQYKINGVKQKRYSNGSYKPFDATDRESLLKANFKTTMGFRQYIHMDEIVFYIDSNIPNIDMYLKNIDWLGTAESMVYLDSIKETNSLENVLVKWNGVDEVNTYKQYNWNSKTKFENVYMYSSKYKHIHDCNICRIKDIILPTKSM